MYQQPTAHSLIAELELHQGKRANFDHLFQDVKELVWPHGGDFIRTPHPGERRQYRQYDQTASLALEKGSSILEALLTPRQQRFHVLKASNEDLQNNREVAEYFEKLTNVLFKLRNRPEAAYYDQQHESWKSALAFGNRCRVVMPSQDRKGLAYRNVFIGQVWVAADHMGWIDTIYYKYRLTAKAAMEKWGPKRAPKSVHDKIRDGKEFDELDFLHVVKPNHDMKPNVIGPERFPFNTWEVCINDRELIPWAPTGDPDRILWDYGGERTNPYTFSRFTTNPAELYGRGPCVYTLAENQQLQSMQRSTDISGQVSATPPVLTMDDDLLGEQTSVFDMRPGALMAGWLDSQGNPRAKPFISGFNFPLTKELMDQKREVINDAHFITLFQILIDTPNMTATEALLRAQEKGMLIAPMVGRQQSEGLGPEIRRELDLVDQLGMMPEMPQALIEAEGEYEVEYSSMATRLQREEEVQGIISTYADFRIIGEHDPNVSHVLDGEEAGRFIANARGVPAHMIRDHRAYLEEVGRQAEAAMEERALQAVPDMAKAAKDASSAGMNVNELGGGSLAA